MNYNELMYKHDCVSRCVKIGFTKFFDDFDLTSMQAMTLNYIITQIEYGDVFTKDLESFLSIRGPSVTSLINNLEASGYVRRETAGFDGRYKRLLPTKKALDIKDDISRRIDEYTESLFVGISDEDLKIFESVIEKMLDNAK